ncbi:MAG: protoporphyrinogen oxidase [Acidobacteria bacterium]|nr:protoporphyrinogen oxidase [Acidobacteriota bacterium]
MSATSDPNQTAIIGGGITGLAAAWELAKAGQPAVLIEKDSALGGVIRTDHLHGCVIEAGPDSFLAAKPAALELINEMGLADQVIGSNDHLRVTYILKGGRLIPMPDGLMMMIPTKLLPVAMSPLLGWGTKLKMGLEYFSKSNPDAPERSVAQLVREHYGQEAVDYLAEPLLSGVYGGDPETLSANAVLGQFIELEKTYGSLTKGTLAIRAQRKGPAGSLFKTLKGGLGQLIDALSQHLEGKVERVTGTAQSLAKTPTGWRITLADHTTLDAAKVLLAAPAGPTSKILAELDPELSAQLAAIPYNSSMTIALGYDRKTLGHPLNGFGFLVPKVERRKLVACTWVGTKFNHRVPDDKAILRCFLGGAHLDEADDSLVAAVKAELADLMGVTAEPAFVSIQRWRNAMAQYTLGHQQRVKTIRQLAARHPGLALAGNAYEGIGIPDCIRGAREAVKQLQ